MIHVTITSSPYVKAPEVYAAMDGEMTVTVPEQGDDVKEAAVAAEALIRHFYERAT